MNNALQISPDQFQAVTELWRSVASFPASDMQASREHLLRRLAGLIDTETIWWVGAVNTEDDKTEVGHESWEIIGSYCLDEIERDRAYTAAMHERYAQGSIDSFTQLRLAEPGACICHRPVDVMSAQAWQDSWFRRDVREQFGLGDVMVATSRFEQHGQSHIGLDRTVDDPPFTEGDRDLLKVCVAGLNGWHREHFVNGGWLHTQDPLTPREHEVLGALLTSASEKQIADQLGLTTRSAHQYITKILRSYGVSGRRGLMALFLRCEV